ncbi:MAG TPA: putative glycoside hydrolase [Chloroflexia bacterium]|nr:putative glycoside hydrolase [Chloroflexia bacterium]
MVRKAGKMSRPLATRAARVAALILASLFVSVLAGCSIGPIELGPSGTPVPTNTPTNTPIPPSPTPLPRPLGGTVEDAYTGEPIANAEIEAGGVLTETTATGEFGFDHVPEGVTMKVSAPGYEATELSTGKTNMVAVKLRPTALSGRVTDAASGKALAGVLVKLVLPVEAPSNPVTATTTTTGTVEATAAPVLTGTTTPEASLFYGRSGLAAPLAATAQATEEDEGTPVKAAAATNTRAPTSTPAPPTATATPKPVAPKGEGFVAVYTDDNGNYTFTDVPENASLTFKVPGYKLTKMPVGATSRKDVALEEFKIYAIYITANVAAFPEMYDDLLAFIDESMINAVVLNVQSDTADWVFDVKNPDVLAAGNTDIILPNMPELVKSLKDRGIYTIARFVTFQQAAMADAHPEWAVRSSVTGKPWVGGELNQQRWLDPTNPAAVDHVIDMTREVLGLGFDEIQFDYIRFPSDPAPIEDGDPIYSRMPMTDTGKSQAIQQFMKRAHEVIEPTDSFMSIDIFGYSLWPNQNGRPLNGIIGQVYEDMIDYTDYVSPMIYPSHFSPGELGCPRPEACAYEIIKKAGEFAEGRHAGKKAKYRPWLQDFDWGRTDYTSPGTTKVKEQMQACEETGCWGWMMWDAANSYDPRSAFDK